MIIREVRDKYPIAMLYLDTWMANMGWTWSSGRSVDDVSFDNCRNPGSKFLSDILYRFFDENGIYCTVRYVGDNKFRFMIRTKGEGYDSSSLGDMFDGRCATEVEMFKEAFRVLNNE